MFWSLYVIRTWHYGWYLHFPFPSLFKTSGMELVLFVNLEIGERYSLVVSTGLVLLLLVFPFKKAFLNVVQRECWWFCCSQVAQLYRIFCLGKSILVGLDYYNVLWKHQQQVDKFLHLLDEHFEVWSLAFINSN